MLVGVPALRNLIREIEIFPAPVIAMIEGGVWGGACETVLACDLIVAAPDATFGGVGFCYLETGGGRAVKADGSFFALPHPVMRKQPPDEAQFRDKLDWVARQLEPIARL